MASIMLVILVLITYFNVANGCFTADKNKNTTLDACEGSGITIVCCNGTIEILTANYGRLNTVTCVHSAMSDTNCKSPTCLTIVRDTCEDKVSCSVNADNSLFGDNCGGTYKYLTITFRCVIPSATTTKRETTLMSTTTTRRTTTRATTSTSTTTPRRTTTSTTTRTTTETTISTLPSTSKNSTTRVTSLTTLFSTNQLNNQYLQWKSWDTCVFEKKRRRRISNKTIETEVKYATISCSLVYSQQEKQNNIQKSTNETLTSIDEIKSTTNSTIQDLINKRSGTIETVSYTFTGISIASLATVFAFFFIMDLTNIFVKFKKPKKKQHY